MNYKKFVLVSTILLFFIGGLMHFAYEFSENNVIVGLFSPVNESVWEHTKMALIPIILLWTLYYLFKKSEFKMDKDNWFLGCLVSIITTIFLMITFYYFYTGAFGIESVVVDILILLFSLLLGQLLGIHYYNTSKSVSTSISISIILAILLFYILVTFNTPKLPLFEDSNTNTYGINMLK